MYKIIESIERVFKERKVEYRLIIPLRKFQEDRNRLKKTHSPEVSVILVCYFVFEVPFQDFSSRMRKEFPQHFENGLIMDEVTEKIRISG